MATVASVYAKAAFQLAQEKNQLDGLLRDLRSFQELVASHRAFAAVATGAGVDPNRRNIVVSEVITAAGIEGLAKRLLEMLCCRGRLGALPQVLGALEALQEKAMGVMSGSVSSAVELSADEVAVLGAALAKRVGHKVKLSQEVDPSVLGGFVAKVGGRTFDASLRTQLDRFKNELN